MGAEPAFGLQAALAHLGTDLSRALEHVPVPAYLVGRGASTAQIADALGISNETARNHIRGLLKRLHQSSRVAAVAYARRHGLI